MTPSSPTDANRTDYEWTPVRRAVATVIVVLSVTVGAAAWRVTFAAADSDAGDTTQTRQSRREKLLALYDLTDLQVERAALLHGGPWKDGIPSITTARARADERDEQRKYGEHPPRFARAADADFLKPNARCVVITIGDSARAYPLAVLNLHEIVNDIVGKIPIAVIYCPLCDSVSVVDRRVDGDAVEFGVSGLLHQSNVVMYDRTHRGLWSQVMMKSISGKHAGRSLRHLDGWAIRPFREVRERHADIEVLSFDTGFRRRYTANPYAGYFETDKVRFGVKHRDDRLSIKQRVVGVRFGEVAKAYPLDAVAAAPGGRLVDEISGQRVVLVAKDEQRVRVEQIPQNAQVVHTFWFTWAAFFPRTEIYGDEGAGGRE